MASPTQGFPPFKFRLLQETVGRLDSVASTAPGSTRTAQGVAVTKKWMKLDAQGVVSYIQVGASCPTVHVSLISQPEERAVSMPDATSGRQASDEQRASNPVQRLAATGS